MTRLPLTQPPKSLCILRLSALGDVTHVVPVVRSIQRHWPETEITWIIGQFEHKLVGDLPGVTFVPYAKGKKGARRSVAAALAGKKFDVLLNLQVALRANLLSTLVSADIRLGYDLARSKDFHSLFINHRIEDRRGEHVVDCFFGFLDALGLVDRERTWDIPISAEARAFAASHLPDDRPNLIISPCSSHALRNWSAAAYAAVADYALARGMNVVLCGGPSAFERDFGLAIESAMKGQPLNLIGKDTLKQLLALLERADLVISPDSGPAHMASAVGTPVIGLYAASNPQRSGPYRFRDRCVDRYDAAARMVKGRPASALKWGTKLEKPGVMDLIEVEAVTAEIDRFLASRA